MLIHEQGPDKEPLGILFFRALRKKPKTKNIPVVMLTGMATFYNKQIAKDLKAADFIVKNTRPFTELLKRIKEIVTEHHKNKQQYVSHPNG